MSRQSKGFTLLELIIVVFIFGIMVAIAIPSFIIIQNRANEGMVRREMGRFQRAVQTYAGLHQGIYPIDVDDIIPLLPGQRTQLNPFTKRQMDYNNSQPGNISFTSNGKSWTISGQGAHGRLLWIKRTVPDYGNPDYSGDGGVTYGESVTVNR